MMKKIKTKNLNIEFQKKHLTNVREGKSIIPIMGMKLPVRNQSNFHIEKNNIPVKVVTIIKIRRSTNCMKKF